MCGLRPSAGACDPNFDILYTPRQKDGPFPVAIYARRRCFGYVPTLQEKNPPPFLPHPCQVVSFGLPIMYRVAQWFLGAYPIMNAGSDDAYSPGMQSSCVPSNEANP